MFSLGMLTASIAAHVPRPPSSPLASRQAAPLASRQADDVPAALGVRLHVMNLEPHMTASRLALAFRDYAPVHASIVPPASATSVAHGFVTFSDVSSATQALGKEDKAVPVVSSPCPHATVCSSTHFIQPLWITSSLTGSAWKSSTRRHLARRQWQL